MESEITQVEEDKVALSKELIDLNREALAWEKKIQMCVEAKHTIDKERSEGGEVGNMKAEIHRMEVSKVAFSNRKPRYQARETRDTWKHRISLILVAN